MEDFSELVEPYRAELRVHCYRMLGSLSDAEDVVQETMVAAWRGLGGFEGRSSLRAWLYKIATNRCLNARRDAARRVPPPPVPPFHPPEPSRRGEITWLQPFPDALLDAVPDRAPGPEARYDLREAVELAFVVGLQRLPPRQAAVLILRDVLGFPAQEVGELMNTTTVAVKGALQRARATIAGAGFSPGPVPSAELPASADTADPGRRPQPAECAVARRFADAFTSRDVDALIGLLTDDAWLAMPPAPHEYHGIPAIVQFLEVSGAWRGGRALRLVPARANNQPAYACYLAERGTSAALPAGLMVLTLRDGRVAGMTRFLDSEALVRFGLLEPSLAL